MIINLTKSVLLKEWCKITAIGHMSDTAQQIEFTLSHEAIGFFLTPDSPVLVLKVNSLPKKKEESYIYNNWKEINIRAKNVNQYYNVKNPLIEDIEFILINQSKDII